MADIARGGIVPGPPGRFLVGVGSDLGREVYIPLGASPRSRTALDEMRRRLEDGTDG